MSQGTKGKIPLETGSNNHTEADIEVFLEKGPHEALKAKQRNLKDVIIPSDLLDLSPDQQTAEIVKRFNKPCKHSVFTESAVRGNQIANGEFLLGVRNNVPELHGPSSKPIARTLLLAPGTITQLVSTHKQSDLFFGDLGSYVLNVPAGHYALAWSNNKPLIYGSGSHVIIDPTFRFDAKNGLVKQSEPFIQHQTLNIIWVPAGFLAKVWLGSIPFLLPSQADPYVFDEANFQYDPKDGLVKESESYINHGTIHHIRIPAGKLALVWLGSHARILEDTTQPYKINHPLFRMQGTDKGKWFLSATEQFITHGATKRIIPHTGEVAITYDNGNLKVFEPRTDGKPIIITSANHEVTGFLGTGVQTLEFPSAHTKKQRLSENKNATPDDLSYVAFTTRDSLKIGVKLAVVYRIVDPKSAISQLGTLEGLLRHIETVATVDMGKAIQKCTSQEFLSFYHNNAHKVEAEHTQSKENPFVPAPMLHYQDEVKTELARDLKEYGIQLVRLNVETPKILDADIQKQMEQQSIKTAAANCDESIMEQNYRISQKKAEQEARTKSIAIAQQNDALKTTAQAKLESAKIEAQAAITKAEADRKVKELQGEMYTENPMLFQLELARIQVQIFQNAALNMTSPEVARMFSNPMAFFNQGNPQFAQQQQHQHPQVEGRK